MTESNEQEGAAPELLDANQLEALQMQVEAFVNPPLDDLDRPETTTATSKIVEGDLTKVLAVTFYGEDSGKHNGTKLHSIIDYTILNTRSSEVVARSVYTVGSIPTTSKLEDMSAIYPLRQKFDNTAARDITSTLETMHPSR